MMKRGANVSPQAQECSGDFKEPLGGVPGAGDWSDGQESERRLIRVLASRTEVADS